MSDTNFRVVTETTTTGTLLDLPEGASNVVVQPAKRAGYVTVTYLRPMTRVPFDADVPDYVE